MRFTLHKRSSVEAYVNAVREASNRLPVHSRPLSLCVLYYQETLLHNAPGADFLFCRGLIWPVHIINQSN